MSGPPPLTPPAAMAPMMVKVLFLDTNLVGGECRAVRWTGGLAGVEPQKRPSLLCAVFADCAGQHRILGFERVQHGAHVTSHTLTSRHCRRSTWQDFSKSEWQLHTDDGRSVPINRADTREGSRWTVGFSLCRQSRNRYKSRPGRGARQPDRRIYRANPKPFASAPSH